MLRVVIIAVAALALVGCAPGRDFERGQAVAYVESEGFTDVSYVRRIGGDGPTDPAERYCDGVPRQQNYPVAFAFNTADGPGIVCVADEVEIVAWPRSTF